MGPGLPWWRRLGAVLVALVLSVLAFGPGLDALLCQGDEGLAAVAAEHPAVDPAPGGHAPDDHAGGTAACAHGHCHHGAPHAPPPAAASASSRHAGLARLGLPRTPVPSSDLKFRLIRPPRA